jgi:hypothetical protein
VRLVAGQSVNASITNSPTVTVSGTATVGGSTGTLVQNAAGLLAILTNSEHPSVSSAVGFSAHITTNATTNVLAATAYLSSIAISVVAGGTGSTVTVQDKSGTPLKLVNAFPTTAVTTSPTNLTFGDQGIVMTGGMDIVTAGAAAATIDIWVTYLF